MAYNQYTFFHACLDGDLVAVEEILRQYPQAVTSYDSFNGLMSAVRGADFNNHNSGGSRPPEVYHAIVTALLNAGTDVNWQRSDGKTALHFAIYPDYGGVGNQRDALIILLVRSGADPVRADTAGITPAALAEEMGGGNLNAIAEGQRLRAMDMALVTTAEHAAQQAALAKAEQQALATKKRQQKLHAAAQGTKLRL